MDFDKLWMAADRARMRRQLVAEDVTFLRDVVPIELESFPELDLPKVIRHPGGFSVSGASVGTFLRSALLVAGQRAFGKRLGGLAFYERVEKDLAFGIDAFAFPPELPQGDTLLRSMHARRFARTRCRCDTILRLRHTFCRREATHKGGPVAVCSAAQRENAALGDWRVTSASEVRFLPLTERNMS